MDVGGGAVGSAGQQPPRVGQHDGVVVDVDDTRFRRDRLGHLVHVVRGRDPGAEVEELPYPRILDQVRHGTAEKTTVLKGRDLYRREDGLDGVAGYPVGREVVLAAQPVVV